MSESTNQYRTVMGIVQFPPREVEIAGKDCRNVVVRNIGVKEQSMRVSLTLWPSHSGVKIAEGDVLIAEGKFTVNTKQSDEGKKTYFNLSVSKILNFGAADGGQKVDTVNTSGDDEPTDTDDIPF